MPVTAVPGYPGHLENFDLSGQPGIDHTSIVQFEQPGQEQTAEQCAEHPHRQQEGRSR